MGSVSCLLDSLGIRVGVLFPGILRNVLSGPSLEFFFYSHEFLYQEYNLIKTQFYNLFSGIFQGKCFLLRKLLSMKPTNAWF